MGSLPWKPMVYAALTVLFIAVVFVPDPNARELSTLTTDELVAALSSPRDTVRRAVSGQLIARAKTVVPNLLAALPTANDQQRRCLFDVLEELMLSSDPEVAESAESALERLSVHLDRQIADDALRLLQQNGTLRHGRAVMMFTELAGHLEAAGGSPLPQSAAQTWSYYPNRDPVAPLAVLDSQWAGGDQGLKYVARMFPGEMLAVHITQDAPVSEEAIARLRTSRDRLTVRREFESCLGVIVDARSSAYHVTVAGVVADSPADRAGLRTGDAIVAIEGRSIEQFEDLIRHAVGRRPGDFVHLTLQRHNQTIRMRLALGSDFRTGRCRCVE
ncbi:MAG TPA: PDZ domain-containing protein [Planctomycetaceae bacterium]|nr:PDZ domain-containing protein [Planctomycetaceae bacterium]